MSRTTLYAFPESGPGEVLAEFGNSWGSAAYVWSSLSKKYLGNEHAWLSHHGKQQELWNLVRDDRLTPCERMTHASTFDRWLVHRDQFAELAKAYREFVAMHPPGERACHLPAMARLFDGLVASAPDELPFVFEVFAVGWQQTSVSENLWWVRGEEEDDGRMYDLGRDTGHHWLHDYDWEE